VSSLRIPIQLVSMRRSVLFGEHHVMTLWEIAVATIVPDHSRILQHALTCSINIYLWMEEVEELVFGVFLKGLAKNRKWLCENYS
jgi:hypothetical protein